MLTLDNTEGYTQDQLDALNAELVTCLARIDLDDTDAREQATKAFSDEVSHR